MPINITEGMFLHEVAALAKENKIPIYIKNRFGTSIKDRIEVDGIKIWLPMEYRTENNELRRDELKLMKLKEMVMHNGEKAYFLEPHDSHITEGMNFGDLRKRPEHSHTLIKYADNSLVGGIKIGGVPIYFPLKNRMSPNSLNLAVYDLWVLKKSEGDRLQYFLAKSPN